MIAEKGCHPAGGLMMKRPAGEISGKLLLAYINAQPWVQRRLDTMVGRVACCHGVKDHHADGPWMNVTCCHGVKDHHDDGSWIDNV